MKNSIMTKRAYFKFEIPFEITRKSQVCQNALCRWILSTGQADGQQGLVKNHIHVIDKGFLRSILVQLKQPAESVRNDDAFL